MIGWRVASADGAELADPEVLASWSLLIRCPRPRLRRGVEADAAFEKSVSEQPIVIAELEGR